MQTMTMALKRARCCLHPAIDFECGNTELAILHLLVHVWAAVAVKLQNSKELIKSATASLLL